jgi:hypothetical protein
LGHTATAYLPPDLSTFTPEDPLDVWAGPCCLGLHAGAGRGVVVLAVGFGLVPGSNVHVCGCAFSDRRHRRRVCVGPGYEGRGEQPREVAGAFDERLVAIELLAEPFAPP